MHIETIYKVWCPKCSMAMFVNNGDTSDLTGQDVEGVKCPYCKLCFKLGDEDGDSDEPFFQLAQKQLKP